MFVKVTFKPSDKVIKVRKGTTIMHAAAKAGIQIRSRCGGKASCLMCKVKVDPPDGVFPKNRNEIRKMGNKTERLACQAQLKKDTDVYVPEDPLRAAVRAQIEKQKNGEDLW